MKIITIEYLDKEKKNNTVINDLFVASTKEENNIKDALKKELGHKYVESETQSKVIGQDKKGNDIYQLLDKVYLTREQAQNIAIQITKDLGYENNESLIKYVLNKFEVICLLQREKQESEEE